MKFKYLVLILLMAGCSINEKVVKEDKVEENVVENNNDSTIEIEVTINDIRTQLILYDNQSAKEFKEQLPLDITMGDLNSNEKFFYLDQSIISEPKNYLLISKGELVLFGSDCLVLFYEDVSNNYSYTKIGYLDDLSILDELDNREDINIKIEILQQP